MSERSRIASLEETERGLRTEIASLRLRLLALAAFLPPEHLGELGRRDGAPRVQESGPIDLFTGWIESTQLTPSDVAAELTLLWQRSPRAS